MTRALLSGVTLAFISAIPASTGWAAKNTNNTVYVTNSCGVNLGEGNPGTCNISEYSIASKTGELAALKGSPVAALPDSQPQGIAVTPNGKFAYVVGFNSNTITAYARSSGGTLKAIPNGVVYTDGFAPPGGGSGFGTSCPEEAAIDETGKFLYVTDECNPLIYQFAIDSKSGLLSALPVPPFNNGAVASTEGIAIDSAAGFVYATDPSNADVIEMSIDTTGGSCGAPGCLVFIGTVTDSSTAFTSPSGVVVDPSGKYVYAVDPSAGIIASFSINGATGALTALADNSTNLQVPENVIVEPSGKFVYVADPGPTSRGTAGGSIAVFQIDTTTTTCGMPGCVFPVTLVASPNHGCPFDLAVDPSGKFLFGSEICFNNVLEYAIELTTCTGGSPVCLTPLGTGLIPAGVEPWSIVVGDPPQHNGRHN